VWISSLLVEILIDYAFEMYPTKSGWRWAGVSDSLSGPTLFLKRYSYSSYIQNHRNSKSIFKPKNWIYPNLAFELEIENVPVACLF
jgi:hypothetical protein